MSLLHAIVAVWAAYTLTGLHAGSETPAWNVGMGVVELGQQLKCERHCYLAAEAYLVKLHPRSV